MTTGPEREISSDAGPPPFVVSELSERCMGDVMLAGMLLDKFEKQMRADVRTIAEQTGAGDLAQVARTLHALKGAAGTLAALPLQELARTLEESAKALDLGSIEKELEGLRAEVDRCLNYLPTARRLLASDNGTERAA